MGMCPPIAQEKTIKTLNISFGYLGSIKAIKIGCRYPSRPTATLLLR